MTIAVFDSGMGGKSVAQALEKALPNHKIIFQHDSANLPYGTKTPQQLLTLVTPILHNLQDNGADLIVIACNTVTTTIISQLRAQISIPLIGIEPMIKPAATLTKSGVIAVCATPTTLESSRYKALLDEFASHLTVLEPDCSQWATMIEGDSIDVQRVRSQIANVCQYGADVIVLGCTHFHWIEQDIKAIASQFNAHVIQPESAIVEQTKRVLQQLR
jgi:glutamate racemase